MKSIKITKWEKTQHYKTRNPPWIRLYVDITEKYDKDGQQKKFHSLSDTAKLTFIMLLCISSKFNNNIPYESDAELKTMLGLKKIELNPLFSAGYICASNNASNNASNGARDVLAPETETETEYIPSQEIS